MTRSRTRKDLDLLYLCHEFPVLTQTFTVNEVSDLAAHGLKLRVFSCRFERSPESRLAEGASGIPVDTAEASFRAGPWLSLLRWLARRPIRMLGLAGTVATGAYRDQPVRCWLRGFLQLLWGASLADRLRAAGLRPHLHAQFVDAASTVAFVAARLLDSGFSMTNHTAYNPYLLIPKLRRAAFVASISNYDRRLLLRMGRGVGRDRILVVYQGIDAAGFCIPHREARRDEAFRILSVAALRRKKGHHVLIESVGRLRSRGRDVRVTIVGEGPERPALEALILELGLGGSVFLVGAEPPGRVRERLAEADVFVLACTFAENGDVDGIPVSLMEAMAARVPVVSTRISGVPELVADGQEGILAAPGDAEDLARAVERLIESPKLGARLASRGEEKVRRQHDRRATADRMTALLRSAIREGGRR